MKEEKKTYACNLCNQLIDICGELGNRKICENLMDELYKGKITEEEMIEKISDKFGKEKFENKLKEKNK